MPAPLEQLHQRREDTDEDRGFTLIELLIVIVILGILAAIVVFAVQNLTGSSAKAACGSDLKTVETAAESYKAQVGIYPGGTIPDGWNLNPAASVPIGYPANGGPPATNYTTAMEALLGSATNGADTMGPWLKDAPYSPSHYSIVLSNDGQGTVSVVNSTGTVVPTGCAGIS